MRKDQSAIIAKANVQMEIEAAMKLAREPLVRHPIWTLGKKPRLTAETAFYSMFLAVRPSDAPVMVITNGGHFMPDKIVWSRTLWSLCQPKFRDTLANNITKAEMLDALEKHLSNPLKREAILAMADGQELISSDGVRVLNEMIEVLMLLEELPE